MKKKKGFTLVELLAVIAILAIILLIAVPLILGVIDNAKKDSFKNSTLSLFKAAELKAVKDSVTSGNIVDLPMSGTKFLTGKWNYNNVDGSVTLTQVCNGEYKVDAVSSKNTDMTIVKDNGDCGFQIVVNGNNPDNVSCSATDTYVDAGAKYDENNLTSTDKVDLKYAGTYNLNYTFGKFITTRIVNVTNTNTPTLELTTDSVRVIMASTFNASEFIKTATDPCEGNVISNVEITSDVDTNTIGNYVVTYKLKNRANIETSKQLLVVVYGEESIFNKMTNNSDDFATLSMYVENGKECGYYSEGSKAYYAVDRDNTTVASQDYLCSAKADGINTVYWQALFAKPVELTKISLDGSHYINRSPYPTSWEFDLYITYDHTNWQKTKVITLPRVRIDGYGYYYSVTDFDLSGIKDIKGIKLMSKTYAFDTYPASKYIRIAEMSLYGYK